MGIGTGTMSSCHESEFRFQGSIVYVPSATQTRQRAMAASKQPLAIAAGLNQDTREIKLWRICKMQTIVVVKYAGCSLDGFKINNLQVKSFTLQYLCDKLSRTVRRNLHSILGTAGKQIYLRINISMKTVNIPVKFV